MSSNGLLQAVTAVCAANFPHHINSPNSPVENICVNSTVAQIFFRGIFITFNAIGYALRHFGVLVFVAAGSLTAHGDTYALRHTRNGAPVQVRVGIGLVARHAVTTTCIEDRLLETRTLFSMRRWWWWAAQ